MRQTNLHHRISVILILLTAAAFPAAAQDQPQQPQQQQQDNNSAPPKPAAREILPLISNGQDQNDQSQDAMTPDTTPLTGAQSFTLGTPNVRHSYWLPGFSAQNTAQSGQSGSGSNGWVWSTYLLGTLSARVATKHSELRLNYSGGGSLTNSSTLGDSYYHGLSFSQTFNLNRWQLLFMDSFSYSPQSNFGFGGGSGISTPGVGGSLGATFPGLQNSYDSGQSLFSAYGPRVNNSFVTQVDYDLTPRSSLTMAGSYGLLHFINGNNLLGTNIDTRNAIGSLGYNYAITSRDTIGALYRFTEYQYVGTPETINVHTINAAYGKRITGRLEFQLFGGPDVTTFSVPIGGVSQHTSFSGSASLTYALERGQIALKYSHGVSGGSGAMIGSSRDAVDSQYSTRLFGRWGTNFGLGYARNGSVTGSTTAVSSALQSLFVSAGLNHELSHTMNFNLSYMFGYQNASQSACPSGGCGSNYTQHQIWMGFRWRARPMVIR